MSTPHQTTHRRLSGKYQIRLVRLSKNSSKQIIFKKSKAEYEETLSKSGYPTKLSYTNNLTITTRATGTATPSLSNNSANKNRKRYIIWFNPPFSMNVKNNIGQNFLQLIDKHVPCSSKLHKIFNCNIVEYLHTKFPTNYQKTQ